MPSLNLTLLYAHTGIEFLAGSLLLIRGSSTADKNKSSTGVDRLYRRWHGAGLLSLSYMGYLACYDQGMRYGVNNVCLLFHTLASVVMFIAVYDGKKGETSMKQALLNPHNILTAGFIAVKLGY